MRARQSQQINRAYYARGRPQNRLPRTINEGTNEMNFTEQDVSGSIHRQNDQTQPSLQPTLRVELSKEDFIRKLM